MNLFERIESWFWIRPIPTRPPKTEDDYRGSQKGRRLKKTLSSHLKEWQKERKYNYAKPASAFSQFLAKSARNLNFKSGLTNFGNLSETEHENSNFRKNSFFKTKKNSSQNGDKMNDDRPPLSFLYASKIGVKFSKLEEDSDDLYLLPKPENFVAFENENHFKVYNHQPTSSGNTSWLDLNYHKEPLTTFLPAPKPSKTMLQEPQIEPDSDPEDDPGKLLNTWLGQLDNLKQGLNSPPSSPSKMSQPPVMRRKNNTLEPNHGLKTQYRCSLINLEECTQDEELDAILGELSVLESKFEEEIADQKTKDTKKDHSPVESVSSTRSSGLHSRSSSGSVDVKRESDQRKPQQQQHQQQLEPPKLTNGGKRTDSPDNDSAFCDNLSVLSSNSASSLHNSGNGGTPAGGNPEFPANLSPEEQEARIKAEKIKLALEKIKEANIKKIFIKVFTAEGSAKSLLVDEKMSVGHVTRILAEKNHVQLDPKWALVELIPDLYMERVYEDHENLVENCLMWKMDSKNTLWFMERPEKFDVFRRPEVYLLGSSSSQRGDSMEDHARQELIEEYFSSSGVGAPEVEGFVWLKAENKKNWKKFYFVLRSSGLYYAPKGKKTSKDLVCLATFDVNQVYYGIGCRKKYKAPTDFCFAIKHPQIQVKTPKYIRYLCVDTEKELHQWVTGIRVAKSGRQLFENYRGIEEEITHADIDILTSKRFSGMGNVPPNTLQIMSPNLGATSDAGGTKSPARTPSSENKSFDSALSSGHASEIYSSQSIASQSIASQHIKVIHENEVTPVNTLERSSSVCPSTSSSSGCLSDRSSNGSFQAMNAFESDFPAGGTIKKRPSVNPRIPLTNTTWGLVGSSDNDEESSANVRVGGGGTLLRHSLRRKSSREQIEEQVRHHRVYAQIHREPVPPSKVPAAPPVPPSSVDPLSEEFETSLNDVPNLNGSESCEDEDIPLPPPPRAESMDLGALVSPTTIAASNLQGSDLDDLPPPPPPPEIQTEENPYHISPVIHSPPALPPPSMLKQNGVGSKPGSKKISFNDHVQLIGISAPVEEDEEEDYQPWCPKNIITEIPKKLPPPPEDFLQDLQRVMDKKWQIAERCRGDKTNPHQVLGFRDQDTTGRQYSRDDKVGAWVLQTQKYAAPNSHQQQQQFKEPLYAVSTKAHINGVTPLPPLPPQSRLPPVVLREPTPEYDPYSMNGYQGYGNPHIQHQQQFSPRSFCSSPSSNHSGEVASYSTLAYSSDTSCTSNGYHTPSPTHQHFHRGTPATGSLQKRAPPPPRRSETTQLTTT